MPISDKPEPHISVRIWRGQEDGELFSYQLVERQNQTVLDVVTEVQRQHQPDLAYRFSCRVGVCGSCAMMVNGIPRWTCRTHVSKVIEHRVLTIEPLRNLPRIKDLVCDMSGFIDTWQKAGAPFSGNRTRQHAPARVDPESPSRKAADASLQCINCAVCYSACDVVNWDRNYIGPAGLNRAWSLVNDIRHINSEQTFNNAFSNNGCASCHSHGNCTRHCPVELSPSESIAGLKRMAFTGPPKNR